MAGILTASILILSIAVFSGTQAQSVFAHEFKDDVFRDVEKQSGPIPQPNDEDTILVADASEALFQPAAGLSNVFGPKGLFPFEDTFDCADSLDCGVSAGDDAKFKGVFDESNNNKLTGYEATYTSPITYGPHQKEGHKYKITLTDLEWNSTDAAMPTRQAEFTKMVNNVGFNQIQHGASYVDRSDVPQLFDLAFLYGHAKITDVTDGKNDVVAEDVFTHVMVAHVMDEKTFYRSVKDEASSQTLVFLFAINIPNNTELPGLGKLSAAEAQSFTPLPDDPSLDNPPQFDYPVEIPEPREGQVEQPKPQSTTWPVANPEQPLYFTFLTYQDADVRIDSIDDDNDNDNDEDDN